VRHSSRLKRTAKFCRFSGECEDRRVKEYGSGRYAADFRVCLSSWPCSCKSDSPVKAKGGRL
jgi:hypothetical protein